MQEKKGVEESVREKTKDLYPKMSILLSEFQTERDDIRTQVQSILKCALDIWRRPNKYENFYDFGSICTDTFKV